MTAAGHIRPSRSVISMTNQPGTNMTRGPIICELRWSVRFPPPSAAWRWANARSEGNRRMPGLATPFAQPIT